MATVDTLVTCLLIASVMVPFTLSLPFRDGNLHPDSQQSEQKNQNRSETSWVGTSDDVGGENASIQVNHTAVTNTTDYRPHHDVKDISFPRTILSSGANVIKTRHRDTVFGNRSKSNSFENLYQRKLLLENLDLARALLSTSYNFSSFGKGLRLMLRGKQLNKRNLKLSPLDVLRLLPLLHSESFKDRMYVWWKTAVLENSLKKNSQKIQRTFSVEALDRIEGDMIFSKDGIDGLLDALSVPNPAPTDFRNGQQQQQHLLGNPKDSRHSNRVKRKITSNPTKYWSGPIQWKIHDKNLTQYDLEMIRAAIKHWESLTCVRFTDISDPSVLDGLAEAAPRRNRTVSARRRPRLRDRVFLGFPKGFAQNPSTSTDPSELESPHLKFIQGHGCYSYVGSVGKGQDISIGEGCAEMGIVAHELGHAIGFYHEHVRPDRDLYIDILMGNIQSGHGTNFAKKKWKDVITNGIPYDYSSLMHYSGTEWSVDHKKAVIQAKDSKMQLVMGQRQRLSFLDVKLANYQFCSVSCLPHFSLEWDVCAHGGYRNPNNCNQCMCPEGWAPPTCQDVEPGRNANCGQPSLVARRDPAVLTSPTFENSEPFENVFCAWHIKAPAGKRIQLTISEQFLIEYDQVYCEEYLEVRYKNVERPGPRLCSAEVTTHEFLTFDNEALLLFHTIPAEPADSKTRHFRVTYQLTDGCGGCTKDQVAISVPVCKRLELYDCSQDIEEDCGDGKTCRGRRENQCFREAPYCCPPYFLHRGECQLPVSRAAPRDYWGRWSEWRACSATCGGCGWRLRERKCLRNRCRGNYIQWQRCAMTLCPLPILSTAQAQCRVEYIGGCRRDGRRVRCVKNRYEPCPYEHMKSRCCGGLKEDITSGLCVEAPSAG